MEHPHTGFEADERKATPEAPDTAVAAPVADRSEVSTPSPSTGPLGGPSQPSAVTSPPAEGAEAEVMSNLPHTRPQRRSPRRTGQASGRARSTAAKRNAGRRRQPAKQTTRPQATTGLPERALGIAVTTATAPLRASVAIARRAGSLIGRLR